MLDVIENCGGAATIQTYEEDAGEVCILAAGSTGAGAEGCAHLRRGGGGGERERGRGRGGVTGVVVMRRVYVRVCERRRGGGVNDGKGCCCVKVCGVCCVGCKTDTCMKVCMECVSRIHVEAGVI